MGIVVFVILRVFVFDTDYDWPIGCIVLSLDSIAFGIFSLGSTLRSCCLKPKIAGEAAGGVLGADDETEAKTEI